MLKRLIFLLLIFLLIAYQYGIVIFLISSTYFASLWAFLLVGIFCFIFLFSDKLILFTLRPVPFSARDSSSHLENVGRLIGLKSLKVFHVKGRGIFTLKGLFGGRYVCIGRELITTEVKRNPRAMQEIVNLAIISSEKSYQIFDQTLYCLINLLFLPATTLERFLALNFLSSFLVWVYYPVKYLILGSVFIERDSIKEEILSILKISPRELEFLKLKYQLVYQDPVDILISSKAIMCDPKEQFQTDLSLA